MDKDILGTVSTDESSAPTSAEMVTLKDGTSMPRAHVNVVMLTLHELTSDPFAFYDIVQMARDPNAQPLSDVEALKRTGLLNPITGKVHDAVRGLIASAIEGEGLSMHFVSPLKDE